MRKFDDHKINDTFPQDIDMLFKLYVTIKIIPCLNWTNVNQAFPNNSLFLRLIFKDKQVKEMAVDLLLDNYHMPNKIRALIGYFYNTVPPRHASTPPRNKENGHGKQVDLKYCRDKKRPSDLPTQTFARRERLLPTDPNYVYCQIVFYFVHSMVI